MAQLKDTLITGDLRVTGNTYNNVPAIGYGTCDTAAATAAKVITIADPQWTLNVGSIIGVKFTNSNSASNVTLNVNNTGAKGIAYGSTYPYTSTSATYCGSADVTNFYQYDGTYWYFISHGSDSNSDTIPSGYSTTAASTAAKTASFNYWAATANSYLQINFRYANTKAAAITLNVNSTGAKPIYINGVASSADNYTLPAGSYIAFYNGTNFYLKTDGVLPGKIEVAEKLGTTGLGGTNIPIYLAEDGTPAVGNTYAGGTAVTLNGTSAASSTVSFYAPTSGGTSNYVLKSNGSSAPTWIAQSSLSVDSATTATKLGSDTKGSATQPIYLNAGAPTACTYTLSASVPSNAKFTDTTYEVVSTSANGLAPKVTDTSKFLKGDGTWAVPTNTTYSAGTGLSLSGTTFNHSNSVTAVTTAGLYKVKYDAQGHITGTAAIAKADITGLGIPSSNTWRNIKVNGTEQLSTSTSSGAVNFINGTNTTVVYNSTNKTIQVNATSTGSIVTVNQISGDNYKVVIS